jgi:hypothetical protein
MSLRVRYHGRFPPREGSERCSPALTELGGGGHSLLRPRTSHLRTIALMTIFSWNAFAQVSNPCTCTLMRDGGPGFFPPKKSGAVAASSTVRADGVSILRSAPRLTADDFPTTGVTTPDFTLPAFVRAKSLLRGLI